MSIRVGINGFGRIGRHTLRALYEACYRDRLEVVAINDMGDAHINAHLLKYDSIHGRFGQEVEEAGDGIRIGNDRVRTLSEADPAKLPWGELGVDLVFECTGRFTDRQKAQAHLDAGAPRVLISAPAKDVDATVVYGVNHQSLRAEHRIVSNASCTTNCLAPVAQVLHREFGIESGLMTTIHAYTNDQALTDVYNKDLYRARSATQSMIPTKTGAAAALGLVLPELDGRLDGMAVRVPTANVSLVDLSLVMREPVTVEAVNQAMKAAAAASPVLRYNDQELVSIDYNHVADSAVFDARQTRVQGRLLKVMAWYDNEWAFSNRMLDTALAWMAAS
ncbi:type I glyceraldehyde-3-phosphate dehydrogenase [Motiliproteus sp. SC1-56]|uniref:type I glyceraldehyde-3-phosphate dehydrogenase n=1 Tax=Motiliproteus sp. SC1-56 TaxID=2799565 RepID=UPI001A8D4CDA|nr:type I glyceraldehyde-3-phosphate dehydrogenase [Motiliproteus sp. SC1-56]